MFNLNINKAVEELVDPPRRTPVRLAWLKTLASPIDWLYQQFTAYRNQVNYDLQFNGQRIYMEHLLNDKWDDVSRGIYIENVSTVVQRFYIYKEIEAQPKWYLYKKWDAAVAYQPGDYAMSGQKVYRCIVANTNQAPPNATYWVEEKDKPILRKKQEYTGNVHFIVWVPSSVVFNLEEMKALINKYKLSDKVYDIQTF